MPSAMRRKKNPEGVRHGLLTHACAAIAGGGLQDLTIGAVATAAGVTKGALFHHFASKDALIEAMFEHQLSELDRRLEDLIDADPVPMGRFTRAYVAAATSVGQEDRRIWGALSGLLVPGSELCRRWHSWRGERLATHAATDSDPYLEVVRLAADGAWLMAITQEIVCDMESLRERLFDMTRSKAA